MIQALAIGGAIISIIGVFAGVIWLAERFLQPPIGRKVFSYQRTRFASYHRPADWYSVPFL